jgi:N-dimethylarginine dimethylaminohydrolase
LVDVWQAPYLIEEFMEKKYPEYDYQKLFIGGHNDSIFSVLRPGLVIAASWLAPYKDIFKGWDIIWFDEPDWQRVAQQQIDMKNDNSGCYWYPDKQDNPRLETFIDKWLSTWHGHSSETIFDVNVLMLDENTCVVNSDSSKLLSELEKRKIEPIVVPLRNRFFWDGGWHCNTLDIYREGNCEDYGL